MIEKDIKTFVDYLQQAKQEEAIALLEEKPSLADAVTEQGISLLLLCAYYRNMDMARLLAQKKSTIHLFEACALGDLPLVAQKLSDKPALLHQAAPDGFYLLGFACFFGHLELVKFLIDQGASVDQAAQNDFKVAPIHSAVANGDYEITAYLISHGADVRLQQTKGVTALHSAAHQGRLDLVELLVKHGASVAAKMEDGKTPLMMAQEGGFETVLTYLNTQGGNT